MAKPLVICVLGPTASGKTDLAIDLAQRQHCELISADSALVYRGLDIGTAKPLYPHRLVSIRDPAQAYSVAEFCRDATAAIADSVEAGKIPLLVGGTMLYFKALLEGLADMPGADPDIRQQLELEAAAQGWPALHRRLAQVDPEAARRIHPNHSQRLGRALEVYLSSGVSMTQWLARQQAQSAKGITATCNVVQLAICPTPRQLLHARIEQRLRLMLDAGFVDEVRGLYQRGDLHAGLPAVRAVGYRQIWGYLQGDYDLDRARDLALIATRQLAKRQLTWLRGWSGLHWIYTNAGGFAAQRSEALDAATQSPVQVALKYLSNAHM